MIVHPASRQVLSSHDDPSCLCRLCRESLRIKLWHLFLPPVKYFCFESNLPAGSPPGPPSFCQTSQFSLGLLAATPSPPHDVFGTPQHALQKSCRHLLFFLVRPSEGCQCMVVRKQLSSGKNEGVKTPRKKRCRKQRKWAYIVCAPRSAQRRRLGQGTTPSTFSL